MKGRKVSDDEDVICTANGWLKDQEQQFFCNGIRALEKRWTKLHETMVKSYIYVVRILLLTVSGCEIFERPSYMQFHATHR